MDVCEERERIGVRILSASNTLRAHNVSRNKESLEKEVV